MSKACHTLRDADQASFLSPNAEAPDDYVEPMIDSASCVVDLDIAAHSHDVLRPDITAAPSENVEPSHVVCGPGAVASGTRPRRVAPRHH
jgi:hypothetical protein